jgi:hypothetical protein
MNLCFVPSRALRSVALFIVVSLATGVSGAPSADKHPLVWTITPALRRAHAVSVFSRRQDHSVRGLTQRGQRASDERVAIDRGIRGK